MTAFDTWLRQLAAANKGGSAFGAGEITTAIRGQAWKLIVTLPGNRTSAVLTGGVRAAPDAPTVLAAFTVPAPTYDATLDKTTWRLKLLAGTGAGSTGSLPADTDGDGVLTLPAMIHITPAGEDEELLFGFAFTMAGRV